MSVPTNSHSEATDTANIEACAAAWLERRDSENWSDPDQKAFDAWMAQSPAHVVCYWRLEGAWASADRLAVLRAPELDWEMPSRRKFRWPALMGLAAGFAVAAAIGIAALHYISQPRDRTYATEIGGRELVTFADGTQIELNTNTVLRARMTTASRTIWLDHGEAYFQVKHDPAHPFIVYSGNQRITDLGTKFLVRSNPARLEVTLLQGRVRIGATDASSRSRLLVPGEEAVATATSFSVTKRSDKALSDQLGWRDGVLIFRYTSLADAVKELNRYNNRKLVVGDPAVGRLKIYGTFQLRDVDVFARAVRDALGLRVSNEGNEIVIER